jgi:hypothetical protein
MQSGNTRARAHRSVARAFTLVVCLLAVATPASAQATGPGRAPLGPGLVHGSFAPDNSFRDNGPARAAHRFGVLAAAPQDSTSRLPAATSRTHSW